MANIKMMSDMNHYEREESNFFKSSIYVNTDMVLSIDALPLVGYKVIKLIESLIGRQKKCLILDGASFQLILFSFLYLSNLT